MGEEGESSGEKMETTVLEQLKKKGKSKQKMILVTTDLFVITLNSVPKASTSFTLARVLSIQSSLLIIKGRSLPILKMAY